MGLAAYILYKNMPPKTDPLGPDNILGFVPGLLTGTGSLFTGRWMVAGKSPLTGTWGEANCGGDFSPRSNSADMMVFFSRGEVINPFTFMQITESGFARCVRTVGKGTRNSGNITKDANGKPCVACIGPEKLS
jgi:aldehyde:ferredoxin oxidoreductase